MNGGVAPGHYGRPSSTAGRARHSTAGVWLLVSLPLVVANPGVSGGLPARPGDTRGVATPALRQPGPLRVTRLSDRVRLIAGGMQNVNVTALRTSKGIILFDAGESIEMGRDIRAQLAREFPGATVTHVVNTHAHWDHVLGNAAFPDATIVGHENCLSAMIRFQAPSGAGETREERRPAAPAAPPPPGAPPPPPRTPLEVHLTPDVYDLTVPDVTFSDDYVIRDGGAQVELVYYGPAHTRSDLVALVADERLLIVGDLYYRRTLPSFTSACRPMSGSGAGRSTGLAAVPHGSTVWCRGTAR